MLRPTRALLLAAGLSLLVASTAVAGDDEVTFLGDKIIDQDRAASLHCHDLEVGIVRCFTTDAEMLDAAAKVFADQGSRELGLLLAGYVVVYEHVNWDGASRTLSQDYPNLGSIGWNDKISSLTSYGATGRFREHSPAAGFIYSYTPNTDVTYLPSPYNDAFSRFEID